jgi:opacity protein-like surface antigen
MKKLSTLTFFIASIAASSFANAKEASSVRTQGHYVGADLVGAQVKFHERNSKNYGTSGNSMPSYSRYGLGAGLNYKYAFNFDRLFIAPGVFVEQNNASAKGHGNDFLYRIDIKNRYGIKTDVGYDLTDTIAPYITGGYSQISYRTRNYWDGNPTVTTIKNSVASDWFYGVGLKVNYTSNISFNVEYNRQSFLAKTSLEGDSSTYQYISKFKTNLDIVKVGLSYQY